MEATVDVKERPILFKGEMVRAILDGRKTQTRRIVKPQPDAVTTHFEPWIVVGYGRQYRGDRPLWCASHGNGLGQEYACPYGEPGDQLWVRESWQGLEYGSYEAWDCPPSAMPAKATDVRYAATDALAHADKEVRGYSWRPSIHMPLWASRIQLEVTDVRVERVQEISEDDAEAEGMPSYCCDGYGGSSVPSCGCRGYTAVDHFFRLWDEINADRGYSWNSNPWVWVVEFRLINAH